MKIKDYANINYIRAAILEHTNQDLSLEDVVDILLQEQMISHKQAQRLIMRDYRDYYNLNYDDYAVEEPLAFEEEQEE